MQAAGLGGVGAISMGGAAGMNVAAGGSTSSAGTQPASATSQSNAASQPNEASQPSRPPETVAELHDRIDPGRLQELMEHLEGFSSAELIIALMLMSQSKQEDQKSGGSELLAGLMMSQAFLGQGSSFSQDWNAHSQISSVGQVGGQLDVSA